VLIKTVAEKLAVRMLADSGDAVIQNAVIAAAAAKVAGKAEVAAALLDCRGGRTAIAISQGR
jgi:hypothetical protein